MKDIIYDGTPASLPHSFQYTPQSDAPSVMHLSGSAWTSVANTKIGLQVEVDGTVVVTSAIWSNGPTTHRALCAGLAEYQFTLKVVDGVVQPVTITIKALNANTIFDVNDYVTVAIV